MAMTKLTRKQLYKYGPVFILYLQCSYNVLYTVYYIATVCTIQCTIYSVLHSYSMYYTVYYIHTVFALYVDYSIIHSAQIQY